MNRIVELPSSGRLIVATDLQGNLGDFRRISAIFEEEQGRCAETYLVLTGDLVHGPELQPEDWPEHLGAYYTGESVIVLEEAAALQKKYPGQVHYLLGNHEHAHIGGPVVGKFFPDEAARLEELLGPSKTHWVRDWLQQWPLVAIASQAGICLLHGAPHAPIQSRQEIETLDTSLPIEGSPPTLPSRNILISLLWARAASPERARAFLRALGPTMRVAIHGHDVAREGFVVEDSTHICVSSSFGCHDGDKVFVTWDLSEPAISALDVARRGLRRLWPEAAPVYLDPSFCEG